MERTKFVSEEIALELFASDSFLPINKTMLKKFGPDVTIFLSNLIDKFKYFVQKDLLENGRWFFLTHIQQMEQTGLTITKIRTCKTFLIDLEILYIRKKGVPAKEWYLIDFDMLMQELSMKSRRQISVRQDVRFPYDSIKETKINKSLFDVLPEKNFITPSMFEKFWKIYPRKADKGKAYTSWCKICRRKKDKDKITWPQIKKAIMVQVQSERWQDKKFIPVPTTWLNQSRWLDDPVQMILYKRDEKEDVKFYDGIRYTKGSDGYFRNKSGEVWID